MRTPPLEVLANSLPIWKVEAPLFAVAAALIGVSIIIFGIKKVRNMLGNK